VRSSASVKIARFAVAASSTRSAQRSGPAAGARPSWRAWSIASREVPASWPVSVQARSSSARSRGSGCLRERVLTAMSRSSPRSGSRPYLPRNSRVARVTSAVRFENACSAFSSIPLTEK
jgi:hypothetical protein